VKLDEYKKKRDAGATNEPFGPEPPAGAAATLAGAFVIHQHDATRMHWDVRLEVGGVLLSFAVPKGVSLDPDAKHLAVMTEDHPLDYLDFEAIIPDGLYGAGPMIVWDRGRVRYLDGPAEEEIARGKIDFELEGIKSRGRFALVKLKNGKGNEWLFFKKADAHAKAGVDLVAEKPRSILSGLTVKELAEAPAIARRTEELAAKLGAPEGAVRAKDLSPMLCSLTGAPDHGAEWLYELKLDGVRAIAERRGDKVTIVGRRGRETTDTYPEVARAVRALPADVVLDGEIVAFDAQGNPNFQRLGSRIHLSRPRDVRRAMIDIPVAFVVFDLLAIGKRDVRSLSTVVRKRLLGELLRAPGVLRVLDHLEGDGRPLLAFCKERKLEGVVAKRKDAPYRVGPRRTDAWVKMKCERDAEFVVVGFTKGERDDVGALDLATYQDGELWIRGKVGSGIDRVTHDVLLARLAPLEVGKPTAKGKYGSVKGGRTHVKPELVVRVRFLGWSDDGNARFPVFEGVRDDVAPTDCTVHPDRELADASEPATEPEPAPDPARSPRDVAAARAREASRDLPAVTNRNKLLWPSDGITKGELVGYYVAIAPLMLRYLRDRPVVLVRYPDGISGKSFFQWNVPPAVPPWVRTCRMTGESGESVEVFLVDDVRTLAFVANLAAIPIHVLASRVPDDEPARGAKPRTLDDCDFLTIDFDVGLSSLACGVELALSLRGIVDDIGLGGFPKTSGQTGLHVLVPLGGASYDTARFLADVLGRLLVQRHPKIATMERVRAKRGPKVYVDTGQTGPTRTIVAPYAVRAAPLATVSAPLTWDEVEPGLDPKRFTIRTMAARAAEIGDPMAGLLEAKVDVVAAVKKLGALLKSG
jgi:bifunctional non-homologous end joining protein LigD